MLWLFLLFVLVSFVLLLGRFVYLTRAPQLIRKRQNVKTMIVLGSGGHTAEMMMLVEKLDLQHYCPRCYVVAETDNLSAKKALAKEQMWREAQQTASVHFSVAAIPRSREVGQSYFTSIFTTLRSLFATASLVLRSKPDLVLVNGPGTCIPICVWAFLYRFVGLMDTDIVYVESIARVQRLSLSGKILYYTRIARLFFVQWEELQRRFPRSLFEGRLY